MLVGRQRKNKKKKPNFQIGLVGFGMLLNEDWMALNF